MSPAAPRQYLLDANVFIEAHRRYYGFDVCPGFWKLLDYYKDEGVLYSIDRARKELVADKGDDPLTAWAKDMPKGFFASTKDVAIGDAYRSIITSVTGNSQYSDAAKDEFAGVADGWLVAYAMVHPAALVTQEVLRPESKKRVPIPNVCKEFGVEYINTFDMLRELNARFAWTPDGLV